MKLREVKVAKIDGVGAEWWSAQYVVEEGKDRLRFPFFCDQHLTPVLKGVNVIFPMA
jgi:hypothetical protein